MAQDDALHAFDDANAHDEARAHLKLRAPGRQRADFKERGIRIQHQRDALTQRHLAAGAQPLHGVLATAGSDFLVQGVKFAQGLEHLGAVLYEPLRTRVEC